MSVEETTDVDLLRSIWRFPERDLQESAKQSALRYVHKIRAYFSQTPDGLAKSKLVDPAAKAAFSLLHSYAPIKDLEKCPVVEIQEITIAEHSCVCADRRPVSTQVVRRWLKNLEKAGWIEIIRKGKTEPNKYRLFPRSKRTWEAYVKMQLVQARLRTDAELSKRLTASLHK